MILFSNVYRFKPEELLAERRVLEWNSKEGQVGKYYKDNDVRAQTWTEAIPGIFIELTPGLWGYFVKFNLDPVAFVKSSNVMWELFLTGHIHLWKRKWKFAKKKKKKVPNYYNNIYFNRILGKYKYSLTSN